MFSVQNISSSLDHDFYIKSVCTILKLELKCQTSASILMCKFNATILHTPWMWGLCGEASKTVFNLLLDTKTLPVMWFTGGEQLQRAGNALQTGKGNPAPLTWPLYSNNMPWKHTNVGIWFTMIWNDLHQFGGAQWWNQVTQISAQTSFQHCQRFLSLSYQTHTLDFGTSIASLLIPCRKWPAVKYSCVFHNMSSNFMNCPLY